MAAVNDDAVCPEGKELPLTVSNKFTFGKVKNGLGSATKYFNEITMISVKNKAIDYLHTNPICYAIASG